MIQHRLAAAQMIFVSRATEGELDQMPTPSANPFDGGFPFLGFCVADEGVLYSGS